MKSMRTYTSLMVLGAVHQFQPVHGYFLRRELSTWHADEWANTRPGSIYNALKSLVKDGYIEEDGTSSEGNYPARTTYRMSSTGEVELLRMVRDVLWDVQTFDTRSALALVSFMFVLTRAEVVAGIEHRITKIDALITTNTFHVEDTIKSETTPAYVREIFDLASARLRAEQSWAQTLLERVRSGEYQFAGE